MAQILDWSDGAAGPPAVTLPPQHVTYTGSPDPVLLRGGAVSQPGAFGRAFTAEYQLDNNIATALNNAAYESGADPEHFDRSFNQYAYLEQNVPKEIWNEKDGLLRDEIYGQGLLRDTVTPLQVRQRIAYTLHAKKLLADSGESVLGSLAGGIAGIATDPISYIPIGGEWVKGGSLLVRAGKGIVHQWALQLPQELALQAQQPERSLEDGLLNVGVNGALFGGALAFGRALKGGHPLNVENPNNPLRPENLGKQGVVEKVAGEEPATIPYVAGNSPASAGAAAVEQVVPSRLGGTIAGNNALLNPTPATRALGYTAPEARDTMLHMIDTNGVLSDTNALGVATAHSAEDIKEQLFQTSFTNRLTKAETSMTELGKELGQVGAPRLNEQDFLDTTQRVLTNTFEPRDRQALVDTYGAAGAQKVIDKSTEFAAFNHEVNARQADAMQSVGAIRDDTKVESLKKELDTLRAEQRRPELAAHDSETTQLREAAQAQIDQKGIAPEVKLQRQRDLRELTVQRDAERRQLAASHDEQIRKVQADLDHEMGLAPALDKSYGHAQLYEPDLISRNQGRFRDLLHTLLADKPDERWLLDAHNLTPAEFEKLKASDPRQASLIRQEWAGDAHDFKLRALENALEDARQREKLAKLDFADMTRAYGLHTDATRQATISEYGRYRDLLNKRLEAARALSAAAREVNDPRAVVKAESRIARLQQQLVNADAAHADARDLTARRKDAKSALSAALSDVKSQRDLAGTNVDQATRATRAARRSTPLDETIDNIVAHLTESGHLPASALEHAVGEPGRFKERRLILTPEMRRALSDEGFLRTDLMHIFEASDKQISGHVALRQALDIGRGRTHETWQSVIDHVNEGYDRLKASNPDRVGELENERLRVQKDVAAMKDRLLNRVDSGADRDSVMSWIGRKMRELNFIRYASGFMLTAVTDVGAAALHHRVIPMLARHTAEMMEIWRNLRPDSEFGRLISDGELAMHGAMSSRRLNEDTMMRRLGIGAEGSRLHGVTSRVDKVTKGISEFAGHWSGLPAWDRMIKIFAGLQTAHDIRGAVANYAGLSAVERTRMASLGIGEREAARMKEFVDKFGETDANGRWDPHLEQWYATREGQQAALDFRIAVTRDQNRTRFWPGTGNRPLWADKGIGKLVSQFSNFSFAFTTSFMHPLLQRMLTLHDARTATVLATLLAWGAISMTMKDAARGISPADRWNPKTPAEGMALGAELLDRSFLLGYLSPYIDAGIKLTGLTGSSRYRHDEISSLLGINLSLLNDITAAGKSLVPGRNGVDVKLATQKVAALMPFANVLRLSHSLYYNDFPHAYHH